jgi:protein-S-isoprenylcysteine O-methyltransferase Ste14
MKEPFMTLKETVLLSIVGITVILNGVLSRLLESPSVLDELRIVAWISFGIGCALVILSMVTLRSKGTKAVIDSGIYAVVRHPMYLSGIFFYVWIILEAQHWIIAILSIVGIVCVYWLTKIEEERCIERFGDAYKDYMESVPRANLLVGVIRLLRRRNKEEIKTEVH